MNPFSMFNSTLLLAFLVVFLLLLAAFAGRRTGWVLLGFLRTLVSYLVAPVQHLVQTVGRLAEYGKDGMISESSRDGSLLRTALTYLRAALVALSLGAVAAGLVIAINTFLPSRESVAAEKQAKAAVLTAQAESAKAREALEAFERSLTTKKSELAESYKRGRQQGVQEGEQKMSKSEQELSTQPSAAESLGKVKAYLDRQTFPVDASGRDNCLEAIQRYLERESGLPEALQHPVRAYAEGWWQRRIALQELENSGEAQMLRALERDRERLADQKLEAERAVENQQHRLAIATEEARLRWSEAGGILFIGIVQFFGILWLLGLLAEVLDRAIGLSDDVARLRERSDPGNP